MIIPSNEYDHLMEKDWSIRLYNLLYDFLGNDRE